MTSSDVELEQRIKEIGKQLSHPPDSVEELLTVLDKVEKLLSKVDQSPKRSMIDALRPSMRALIKDGLSKHSDVDVKVAVASCISEITRITAPDAPYDDNQMRDVFKLIVSTFEGLADQSSRSYAKRASILETASKVRSCVIMLDLECDALIAEMFEHFLKSVRDYHLDSVFPSMESIMVLVIEESEEIPVEMLKPLLARVKKDNTEVLPIARNLSEQVLVKLCKGTTATNENNDENTSGLQEADESKLEKGSVDETQQADESKLTTAASDQTDQVVKEACPEEQVDPTVDKSPKSAMSNGVNVTANEEASVDQESKKSEEDVSQPLNKEDTDDSDTDKLEKAKPQTEHEKESDSSHVEGEKENEGEKDNDVKESVNEEDNDVKDVKESVDEKDNEVKEPVNEKDNEDNDDKESESEKDNDVKESENEAAVPSETEKDDAQVSSPKAIGSKPAETTNVSSPSQSNSVPDERPVRSKKKKVVQEDETTSPSNGELPPDDETLVKNVGRTKGAGKKAVIAKEVKLPETIDESDDGDATSDSDAKPLKKSEPKSKSKSTKQSGKKSKQSGKKVESKQTGKKVDVKADDSDSDAKPLKMSVKKGEKSKITVEEEESDSENKPLKLSAKRSSSKKKDAGKKRGNGKNVAEKEQAKSHSEDDEMDTSPKSVKKPAKGEGTSKETPVTSAKRKRTTVKDNTSDTIKYDESLVGTKVKVWWPEDKMYYEGVVEEFYPAKKKHKVSYVDGDEETLNLRTQRWEIIKEFSQRDDKEQTTEDQIEDASPATHKKKKSKTDPAPSASQEKVKDAAKRGVGASSSGKSKKVKDAATASKEAGKSKEDEETPKAGTKAKTVNKSKGKTPPSGSKSNTNGPTKAKSGSSSNVKESDDVKTPESGKGKSTEAPRGGSKSGKKRKKRN
ncbi:putative sister chromatid cohesion protein Pds5 [Helianthus annuus]|nr:putative sister chromatid cohesion protein Pds5 [Helianthus annuus]